MGSRPKGAMVTKAIMKIANPILAQPIEPIRVMKKVQIDGVDTNEDSTVPVVNDLLFNFEMEKYMIIWKSWKIDSKSSGEINAMVHTLVLSHVVKVLEYLLKSQVKWDKVSKKMDGVGLLLMLRDITHKHNSSVQSTLSYVKTFLEWTLTFQGKNESNTDYYTLFLS